jgi:structural maintenance of chromosomes protein 6
MCHANLALDFNPHVNFIVGKNGSGKSAIMSGVMIVLGTRAADTSRCSSMSSFVRFGCSQAKVKIVLNNSGHCSYKPGKYGRKIILTRIINSKLMCFLNGLKLTN